MVFRATLTWILLAVLAVLNGISRNALVTPHVGEHGGHVISTVVLCVVIFVVALTSIRWIGPPSKSAALGIGILWVSLTVCFEFLAGHYVFGRPWRMLLADYNMAEGRIWALVLMSCVVAPVWAARVRTSHKHKGRSTNACT